MRLSDFVDSSLLQVSISWHFRSCRTHQWSRCTLPLVLRLFEQLWCSQERPLFLCIIQSLRPFFDHSCAAWSHALKREKPQVLVPPYPGANFLYLELHRDRFPSRSLEWAGDKPGPPGGSRVPGPPRRLSRSDVADRKSLKPVKARVFEVGQTPKTTRASTGCTMPRRRGNSQNAAPRYDRHQGHPTCRRGRRGYLFPGCSWL